VLGYGQHTFEVRAVDPAGNKDETPASKMWTVEPPNCGTPTTLTATADAWIDSGSPGDNKGGDSTLKVVSKSGGNVRALLKFTLPAVPSGCVLDTATLRLYAASAKDGRTIEALRLTGAWSEGGVNWGNQPATDGPAATVDSGSTPGWREWDVAGQVTAMLSGSNDGFLIRDANENQDSEQQYNSREKSTDRPQLVVKFKPAP